MVYTWGMTKTQTTSLPTTTDTTPSTVHTYCHLTTPQTGQTITATCGTPKVYLGPIADTHQVDCPVCADLETQPCPTCGH